MVPRWEAGSLSYAGLKILLLTLLKMIYFTYIQEGKRHSQLPGPRKLGEPQMPAEAVWTGHCVRGRCLIRPAGGGGREGEGKGGL